MKKSISIFIVIIISWAVFSNGTAAQVPLSPGQKQSVIPGNPITPPDDKYYQIRQLIAQGAYISAATLLESYRLQDPDNRVLIDLLLNCYTELKAYSKSEELLKQQISKEPGDFRNQYLLLELYLKMGNDTLSTNQLNYVMASFRENKDVYGSVIQMLVNYGRYDTARELIEKARAEYKLPELFAVEAATILETKQAYYDAVMEYFKAVSADTLQAAQVERRVAELIRYPGAPPDVIRALIDIQKKSPNLPLALRMLEEAYVINNQYAEAFDVSVRYDSVSHGNGMQLYQYMRQCRERKLFEQVIKTGEYIERKYPQNTTLSEYRFDYAEALAGVGRNQDAIAVYKAIVKKYPQARDQAEALLQIGNIYRYNSKQYDIARQYYDSVSAAFPFAVFRFQAGLEIARLLVVEGKLDSAEAFFKGIQGDRLGPEIKEEIDYDLARIQFYRHKFDSASQAFRKVIVQYPRGYFLNDAVINVLIIGENAAGNSEALNLYADALYSAARLQPDTVENKLKAIIDIGDSPLVGQAGYKLATFYADRNDTVGALNIIARMEKDFSGNYYFPYCLRLKGDILSNTVGRSKDAIEIYKSLLEKYGNYPFIGEVRKSLQKLEQYRLPG